MNTTLLMLSNNLGSCVEEFQLMPFMECSSSSVCRNGVRTHKSFWLSVEVSPDYDSKPMTSIDVIQNHISRCTVCLGTEYLLTRHSWTGDVPLCPEDFYPLWEGYSYSMVCCNYIHIVCTNDPSLHYHSTTKINYCLGRPTIPHLLQVYN